APSASETSDNKTIQKTARGRRSKKNDGAMIENQVDSETETNDSEVETSSLYLYEDSELETELEIEEGEDISFTYGWPPLVCCFGEIHYAFVPNGRRANRLIDYELHDRNRDALWEPEKFVRSSGGCASNVAISLAKLGGKVAFMGKLGNDDLGQSLLYLLNTSNVQTRAIRLDSKRATNASKMKISRRGGFKMTCVKASAQDSLLKSEINIDVLKEAEMFYFNSCCLLDRTMRSTLFRAIRIAKKLGNLIFYDPNIPLPLWLSSEEAKMFVRTAWRLSDVIEVTKQELELLSGITPSEKFDTRDNDSSKFIHYPPELVSQLWHDDLKVLFVTNGTSKVHYYTKEFNGFVHGSEDALLTPYTAQMSASGDGMVAG
ncbi:hypothetical protein M569_05592, partial [Genlisea aurea]